MITSPKPLIIKKGSKKDCVHHEHIVGYIGICIKCKQERKYYEIKSANPAPWLTRPMNLDKL